MGFALLWLGVAGVIFWRHPDALEQIAAFWGPVLGVLLFFAAIGAIGRWADKAFTDPSDPPKT